MSDLFSYLSPDHLAQLLSAEALAALAQVIMVNLVLSGDNAIVIGLAAAGLPKEQRGKAILIGILTATLLRIGFAGAATQILKIVGLLLAGGLLLLWVCWKMWRELRDAPAHADDSGLDGIEINSDGSASIRSTHKTLMQATMQIVVADVTMSLDNVLAVAGAAREHPLILVFGLTLSIALMGAAANFIAKLLQKHRWIAYVGLAVILAVACDMVWRGAVELRPVVASLVGFA